eukprot:m.1400333 g.1400333  ORF g.1400333 m.1400333 type:complete len:63 (-) comp25003_c0_seq40:187-375(-)
MTSTGSRKRSSERNVRAILLWVWTDSMSAESLALPSGGILFSTVSLIFSLTLCTRKLKISSG